MHYGHLPLTQVNPKGQTTPEHGSRTHFPLMHPEDWKGQSEELTHVGLTHAPFSQINPGEQSIISHLSMQKFTLHI